MREKGRRRLRPTTTLEYAGSCFLTIPKRCQIIYDIGEQGIHQIHHDVVTQVVRISMQKGLAVREERVARIAVMTFCRIWPGKLQCLPYEHAVELLAQSCAQAYEEGGGG